MSHGESHGMFGAGRGVGVGYAETGRSREASRAGGGFRATGLWSLLAVSFLSALVGCAPDAKEPPPARAPSPTPPGASDHGSLSDSDAGTEAGDRSQETTKTQEAAAASSNIPPDNRESTRRVRFFNSPRGITITVESLFGTQVRSFRAQPPGGINDIACGLSGCVLKAYRVDGIRRVDDREFTSEPFAPGTCVTIEPSPESISFRATSCEFR